MNQEPCHFVAPHHPHLQSCISVGGIEYTGRKLSTMVDNLALSRELDLWRIVCQQLQR